MCQISDLYFKSFLRFWWGVVIVFVTGVKQSQLLDLSLGLGLQFDNNDGKSGH